MEFTLTTPVVFCVFNRLDTTKKVFERIREAKPPRLYIISDCARPTADGESSKVEAVHAYIEEHIDWPCEVKKNYAKQNMGCGRRISSGISWVFEQEEQAIILEDDCVPDLSFFQYCQEMLEKYKHDDRITMISGNNPMSSCYHMNTEYSFSKIPFIWGWATWKRAWNLYDYDLSTYPTQKKNGIWHKTFPLFAYWVYMAEFDALFHHKFDTWDYQWMYATILYNKLTIVPSQSHVFNIGFQEESTHTKSIPKWMKQNVVPVKFPINHEVSVEWNKSFDKQYMKKANRHGIIVRIKYLLGLDVNQSIFKK